MATPAPLGPQLQTTVYPDLMLQKLLYKPMHATMDMKLQLDHLTNDELSADVPKVASTTMGSKIPQSTYHGNVKTLVL